MRASLTLALLDHDSHSFWHYLTHTPLPEPLKNENNYIEVVSLFGNINHWSISLHLNQFSVTFHCVRLD